MPSLGERCLAIAYDEMQRGVCSVERYPGRNWSSDIAEYFRRCVRDTDGDGVLDDIGKGLARAGGNWCAASACWCLHEVLEPGEEPPHLYRAGVVEIVADAQESGRYVTADEWRAGAEVRPGDLAIWDRSDPRRPETSWWRHVNRVVEANADTLLLRTIGGNESRRWAVSTASGARIATKLLGFVRYWEPEELVPPLISDDERATIQAQIAECTAELMRGVVA